MADSKPVGRPTLLKTELKCCFERGLLLSSYNIYSQFKPRQMEAFIFELVALEIAYGWIGHKLSSGLSDRPRGV
jgi:hypothetical protein